MVDAKRTIKGIAAKKANIKRLGIVIKTKVEETAFNCPFDLVQMDTGDLEIYIAKAKSDICRELERAGEFSKTEIGEYLEKEGVELLLR